MPLLLKILAGLGSMERISNKAFSNGPGSAVNIVSDCRYKGREFDSSPVPYFRGD